MSATITELQTKVFEKIQCGGCGIEYFVPDHWMRKRKEDGNGFTCPNGCNRIFTDSTADKLSHAQSALSAAQAQLRLERDQKAAAENRLARLKNRVSKGVCPYCHRTVSQMAKHMTSKYPDWKA